MPIPNFPKAVSIYSKLPQFRPVANFHRVPRSKTPYSYTGTKTIHENHPSLSLQWAFGSERGAPFN
jgi:hypothetical protein